MFKIGTGAAFALAGFTAAFAWPAAAAPVFFADMAGWGLSEGPSLHHAAPWLMMLAGFFAMGAAARRTQQVRARIAVRPAPGQF